eukprot:m.151280 g.151280  ORF g.151280 m.151280 type:complete len:51 (-) comp14247_c0_seq7:490-642(-)
MNGKVSIQAQSELGRVEVNIREQRAPSKRGALAQHTLSHTLTHTPTHTQY